MFKFIGRRIASPYTYAYRSIKGAGEKMGQLGQVVKDTNSANSIRARVERKMSDPAYVQAREIKDDKKRFDFLMRANELDENEIQRRIKMMRQSQLFCAVAGIPLWVAAFYFLSQNLSSFNFMSFILAGCCATGATIFFAQMYKSALMKTQLQERDLLCARRFNNHPKFYSKLLNPLS